MFNSLSISKACIQTHNRWEIVPLHLRQRPHHSPDSPYWTVLYCDRNSVDKRRDKPLQEGKVVVRSGEVQEVHLSACPYQPHPPATVVESDAITPY